MRKAHSADSYWKHAQANTVTKGLHSFMSSQYGKYVPAVIQSKLLYPYLDALYSEAPLSRPWKNIANWEEEYVDSEAEDLAVGFKLMYKQLLVNHSITKYFRDNSVSCIHLYRENLLDSYLSGKSLKASGVAHVQSDDQKGRQVAPLEVDLADLKEFVSKNHQMHSERKAWLAQNMKGYLELTYEDLNRDFNSAMNRVTKFLGLDDHAFEATLRKLNGLDYKERVSNWEELDSAMAKMNCRLSPTVS